MELKASLGDVLVAASNRIGTSVGGSTIEGVTHVFEPGILKVTLSMRKRVERIDYLLCLWFSRSEIESLSDPSLVEDRLVELIRRNEPSAEDL